MSTRPSGGGGPAGLAEGLSLLARPQRVRRPLGPAPGWSSVVVVAAVGAAWSRPAERGGPGPVRHHFKAGLRSLDREDGGESALV